MKSFEEFKRLCEYVIENHLPREIVLYMNRKDKIETDCFLKNLGSSGVSSSKIPNTEIVADKVCYGQVTVYIVDTGYSDPENHIHDWKETKTFFEHGSDKYVLSRYCERCGKTQTYHGKDQRWIETGYIKLCQPPKD